MSPLVERFLDEADSSMLVKFAYACADRAVRKYVPDGLAGRWDTIAQRLRSLDPVSVVGVYTWSDAGDAVVNARTELASFAAASAARTLLSDTISCLDAAGAARAAKEEGFSPGNLTLLVKDAASQARKVALGAYGKAGAAREKDAQHAWVEQNWSLAADWKPRLTRETLAAVDAYIADGLLLGDEE